MGQGQAILTKQDLSKQRMNILPTSRWSMHEDKPTTICKGNKTISDMKTERT